MTPYEVKDIINIDCVWIIKDLTKEELTELVDWCVENVGSIPRKHPFLDYDFLNKHIRCNTNQYYLQFKDGWAWEKYVNYCFWFAKEEDRVLFKLTWT